MPVIRNPPNRESGFQIAITELELFIREEELRLPEGNGDPFSKLTATLRKLYFKECLNEAISRIHKAETRFLSNRQSKRSEAVA